ncbi:MAG: hypothetical protein NW224_14080 [Leptolyngbyaceae cyanobacterium bins.302]|nr:hypothetical protein [Leptolyngbyaceae cyanobacterium bins.302]
MGEAECLKAAFYAQLSLIRVAIRCSKSFIIKSDCKMYDLKLFSLSDMTECGAALRKLGAGAHSMEEVADCVVQYLYEQFQDDQTGQSPFALVRCFKTHPYGELSPDLHAFAKMMLGNHGESPSMKCLTLLATIGDRPEWQTRQASQGHQAIPLVSEQLVAQSPMISQLIRQMGLEIGAVLEPSPDLIMDLEQRTFNVFLVADAIASPYVPAQAEFVIPCGIRSVLGFGGMLPSGNLIALVLFSKCPISHETADLFKTLALNIKMAMLPFDRNRVFNQPLQV